MIQNYTPHCACRCAQWGVIFCFLSISIYNNAFTAGGLGERPGQGSGGVLVSEVIRIEGDGCAVGIFKGLLRLKGLAQFGPTIPSWKAVGGAHWVAAWVTVNPDRVM